MPSLGTHRHMGVDTDRRLSTVGDWEHQVRAFGLPVRELIWWWVWEVRPALA